MLKKNKVKQILNSGGVCFGSMLRMLHSAQTVPLSAAAGWDYVIVDMEHCDFDMETLSTLAMAAKYEELALLVRVPDKLYHQLARPLDVGAEGLVIPRVETVEEVQQIIDSTKYFPLGRRGASVSSVSTRFRDCDPSEFLEWSNRETLIIIQIESELGVENAESLISVDGVDGVMIGPFDLSLSMGIPGQMQHPRMVEAYQRVIQVCGDHKVSPGIHLQSIDAVADWVDKGMRFVTYQYDAKLLLDASRVALEQIRSITTKS